MHKHHEESIQVLLDTFDQDYVIAVVLAGSLAKGNERPDSDIDAIIVLTDEQHALQKREGRLSECIHGTCTYEKGYFDLKYYTKDFLVQAADHGSEPTRDAYRGSRALMTRDPEIPQILARIPVYPKELKAEKQLSFYSAISLNAGYFWRISEDNVYLRHRCAADIVLYGLRMVLAEREVLFRCQRRLIETVAEQPGTEKVVRLAEDFLKTMTDAAKEAFLAEVYSLISYAPPADYAQVLTRFIDDNEIWWYIDAPNTAEW